MSNLQRFSKKQTANRPTSTIFWIKPTTNQPPSMRMVEGMLVVLRVAAARQPKQVFYYVDRWVKCFESSLAVTK